MQSSNFDSIGIKPSLFTDKVGEFSFCIDKEKEREYLFSPNKPFIIRLLGPIIKILSFICGTIVARNVSISIWSQAKRKENLCDWLQMFYFSEGKEEKVKNVLRAPHKTFQTFDISEEP